MAEAGRHPELGPLAEGRSGPCRARDHWSSAYGQGAPHRRPAAVSVRRATGRPWPMVSPRSRTAALGGMSWRRARATWKDADGWPAGKIAVAGWATVSGSSGRGGWRRCGHAVPEPGGRRRGDRGQAPWRPVAAALGAPMCPRHAPEAQSPERVHGLQPDVLKNSPSSNVTIARPGVRSFAMMDPGWPDASRILAQ